MKTIQGYVVAILMLLSFALPARADAVRSPATVVKQWVLTATTSPQSVSFTSTTGTGGNTRNQPTCTLRVIHDTGSGPDVYCSLKRTQSNIAAPSNGGEVFTLKTTESLSFDGEYWQFRYMSASSTATIRVIATFAEQ